MNDQEILEALNKSEAIPPVLCMSERSVTFVEYADGHGEAKTQVNNWFRCPRCNGIAGERRFVHKRIIDQRTKQFCEKCGQKMEWGQEKSEPKKLVTVSTPGTEYAVMAKRVKDGTYTRIGGVFGSELLCRKRFEEKVMNGEIFYGIDLKTAVVAKRETVTLMEEWETMGNVNLEM
jgi:hypothetical protein